MIVSRQDLEQLKLEQLRAMCRDNDWKGFSKPRNKAALVDFILQCQRQPAEDSGSSTSTDNASIKSFHHATDQASASKTPKQSRRKPSKAATATTGTATTDTNSSSPATHAHAPSKSSKTATAASMISSEAASSTLGSTVVAASALEVQSSSPSATAVHRHHHHHHHHHHHQSGLQAGNSTKPSKAKPHHQRKPSSSSTNTSPSRSGTSTLHVTASAHSYTRSAPVTLKAMKAAYHAAHDPEGNRAAAAKPGRRRLAESVKIEDIAKVGVSNTCVL